MIHTLSPEDQRVEQACEELRRYAEPLCKEVSETELPPLRAINHTIPLIDEEKAYPWRPSGCPEAFRSHGQKRDAYIKSGGWNITSAHPPEFGTVVDLRERNKNTKKLTSPLPDIVPVNLFVRHYTDLKSAYEQIRIVPKHVGRSAVTTPDGDMVGQAIQMGDCNAPAKYQALMNFLFSSYIGRFISILS